MDVCGQLHAPAVYHRRKSIQYPVNRRKAKGKGVQSQSQHSSDKQKNLLLLWINDEPRI